uniref:Uncharacterized protein n=1 Tax=Solanum tuberosum TaxID=4113 RepID=M1D887_SOLTU
MPITRRSKSTGKRVDVAAQEGTSQPPPSQAVQGKEEGHKSQKQGILRGLDPWGSLHHPKVSLGLGSLTDRLGHHLPTLQLVPHLSFKSLGAISLGKEVKAKVYEQRGTKNMEV